MLLKISHFLRCYVGIYHFSLDFIVGLLFLNRCYIMLDDNDNTKDILYETFVHCSTSFVFKILVFVTSDDPNTAIYVPGHLK